MGSALWEQKKTGMVQKNFIGLFFFFFFATYGNEVISVGGHKENTDLRNCSRLSKHCTKPAFENEMCPKEDQITATLCTAMAAVATADEQYDFI